MTKEEAIQLLNQRVPSLTAVEVLDSLDNNEIEIFGVEGFLLRDDGAYESKLDLMFDLSAIQNLSGRERSNFVRQFIENRVGDNVFFEVYGE